MKSISRLLIIILFVFTLLPLVDLEYWWIRIFDYPRLQYLTLGLIILLIYIFYLRKKIIDIIFLILLLFVIFSQAYLVFPFTPLATKTVIKASNKSDSSSINLFISNVLMSNRNADELIRIIKKYEPQVILLAEPNNWWRDHLLELDSMYKYSLKKPQSNTYGMLFYSNLELIYPEVRYLVQKDIPSVHTYIKLQSGKVIEFYGLHPRPPYPSTKYDDDERDAELLLAGREASESKYPAIIAGDMNDVAWSNTTDLFQRVSNMLDPRVGRGLFNTFNANYFFIRWPLDHIFHTDHFRLKKLERISNHYGSDHFPLFVQLKLDPEAEYFQEAPPLDKNDLEKSRETIKEALQEKN